MQACGAFRNDSSHRAIPESTAFNKLEYAAMRLRLLPIFLTLLAAGDAAALGLGQMTVHSRLGAHFRAEVELVGATTDEPLTANCFRLGQPTDSGSGVPHLTRGHLRLDRQNGKLRLLIRSDQTINDPVLQVNLHAGCSAEVARDYLLIMDPIELSDKRAASPRAALGSDRGSLPVAGSSPSAPDTRRQSKNEKHTSPEPAEPMPERKARKGNPPRTKEPGTERMSDRLSISGNAQDEAVILDGLTLRLATELSNPSAAGTTEGQRSILRLEYKVLAAIHAQASQQLSLAEQVRTLESSLTELRAVTENIADPKTLAPSPAATAPAHVTKGISTTQPDHRTRQKSSDMSDGSYISNWWIGAIGVLGVVALLVWMLRRHSAKATRPSLSLEQSKSHADEPVSRLTPDETPPETGFEETQVADETPFPDESKEFGLPQPDQAPVKEAALKATVRSEQSGFNPVMELADIMLAFGRIKGATEALLEYVEASPGEALQPWVKLLDIYRQNEMRADYESLSQRLKLHFNVEPADWEATPDLPPQLAEIGNETAASFAILLPQLPNIGQITNVRDEIARTWGTPECSAYLNRILRDKRKGERQSFSLSTANELLFVLDILEKRLNAAKPS